MKAVEVTVSAWVLVVVLAGMVQVMVSVVYVEFVVVLLLVHDIVVLPSFAVVVPRLDTGAGKFTVTLVVVEEVPV